MAGVERTGLAVALGLVGGIALGLATVAVSKTDIGGPGWSLRGNGALIVVFAGGPTLLAGGWLALARHRVGPTVIGAALTLAIELGVGFAPILVGPAPGLQAQLLVGLWPAILALLVGLALAPPRGREALAISVLVCFAVAALSLGLAFVLFIIAPLLLPLVVAMPTFLAYARREHLTSLIALPVALVAGTLGSQFLVPPT